MRTLSISLPLLAVVALALVPGSAGADMVDGQMDYQGLGLNSRVRISFAPAGMNDWNGRAGQMKVEYHDELYRGYCVDVYQTAGDGLAQVWAPAELPNGELAAYLLETHGEGVSTGTQAAGLQVAIWEVLNERPENGFDVGSGEFRASRYDAVIDAAQDYLSTLPTSYTPSPRTVILHSDRKQDLMITGASAPEPAAMGLLLVGSGAMLLRRWRQKC